MIRTKINFKQSSARGAAFLGYLFFLKSILWR